MPTATFIGRNSSGTVDKSDPEMRKWVTISRPVFFIASKDKSASTLQCNRSMMWARACVHRACVFLRWVTFSPCWMPTPLFSLFFQWCVQQQHKRLIQLIQIYCQHTEILHMECVIVKSTPSHTFTPTMKRKESKRRAHSLEPRLVWTGKIQFQTHG